MELLILIVSASLRTPDARSTFFRRSPMAEYLDADAMGNRGEIIRGNAELDAVGLSKTAAWDANGTGTTSDDDGLGPHEWRTATRYRCIGGRTDGSIAGICGMTLNRMYWNQPRGDIRDMIYNVFVGYVTR
jgi:hypothetical protein